MSARQKTSMGLTLPVMWSDLTNHLYNFAKKTIVEVTPHVSMGSKRSHVSAMMGLSETARSVLLGQLSMSVL